MSRRASLWLTGLALVVGALLLTDRLLWAPGLTEDNVRRLRPGMTLAEVGPCWAAPPRKPSRCPLTTRHTAGTGSGGTGPPGQRRRSGRMAES
jgi:hypothetical protein